MMAIDLIVATVVNAAVCCETDHSASSDLHGSLAAVLGCIQHRDTPASHP